MAGKLTNQIINTMQISEKTQDFANFFISLQEQSEGFPQNKNTCVCDLYAHMYLHTNLSEHEGLPDVATV